MLPDPVDMLCRGLGKVAHSLGVGEKSCGGGVSLEFGVAWSSVGIGTRLQSLLPPEMLGLSDSGSLADGSDIRSEKKKRDYWTRNLILYGRDRHRSIKV